MNLENHVIQPAIVGRSVDLTPPTTMVAAFVGGAIAGIPGALVATPFVGAAKAIYLEARGQRKPDDDRPAASSDGSAGCSDAALTPRNGVGARGASSLHCETRRPR